MYYIVKCLNTKFKILFVLSWVIIQKASCTSAQSDSQIIFILQFNNCTEMTAKTSSSVFITIYEVRYSRNQY